MFSSQWWFMTTLMQELHMWGLGSTAISCRGFPQKKRNRSISLSQHGFVLDDSSYFDDAFCFPHQKLNPKSSSGEIKGVRTSAGWGCSDIDDYTINKRLQTLQEWGPNGHTSECDRVDPNILLTDLCVRECVSARVSARARAFLHRGSQKRDWSGRDARALHLPQLLLGRLGTRSRIN